MVGRARVSFIIIKKLEAISIFCRFTAKTVEPCYAVDHDGNLNGFVGEAEKKYVNKSLILEALIRIFALIGPQAYVLSHYAVVTRYVVSLYLPKIMEKAYFPSIALFKIICLCQPDFRQSSGKLWR